MKEQTWPSGRIVHLAGGCKAVNPPGPNVTVEPSVITGQAPSLQLPNYSIIYSALEHSGLKVIGVDFISNNLAIKGIIPPDWRPFYKSKETPWTSTEIQQTWSNIGHAAFEKKDGYLWDLASRVTYQLRACCWRLREISEAYDKQLTSKVASGKFEAGQLFEDGYTIFIYLALQTFLVDACILRDYLAEFVSGFICGTKWEVPPQKLSTMSALKNHVLDKYIIDDELFLHLKSDTEVGGWLNLLGNYRNLVVHSAPLAQAESILFVEAGLIKIKNGVEVPIIISPIPADPSKVKKTRDKGEVFKNFESKFESFIQAAKGEIPKIDGLEYAADALGQLGNLAALIARISPVSPQMVTFDASNIKGPITVEYI